MGIVVYSMFTQPLLRLGLEQVLSGIEDCAYAGEMTESMQLRQRLLIERIGGRAGGRKPLLVLDYHPDDNDQQQWLVNLRKDFPELRVLVFLPMLANESVVVRAMRLGAHAYLFHTATPEVVTRAIREISVGRSYLQSHVTPIVLAEIRRPRYQTDTEWIEFELTERDRMLLQLAADGLSNVQIGQILGLAEKTVRNAWSQLFEKLGMTDRTQAVLWAIRGGHAELR
ncbi:LuxR C-terminal-related transcriptional regulator [Alicyclobacillus ferrooxydans]|uniref:HTH luxR-type domain-containing protein n=1 Tax=Alicyclobacillus ferrooxydans TaxID=471514 RepID=A0A0P9CID6_9BACL|nr:response regulator transcription factor [Alicyclobacillus ferrooxydans]KPV45441.1 hypothetical protein AN477_00210 [Alicyclobacillus ferrooxydans]